MGFVIYIRTLAGEFFTLTVDSEDTVKEVKRRINGNKRDHITLIFAGSKLEDEHTLGSYNIQDGYTLNVIGRGSGEQQPTSSGGEQPAKRALFYRSRKRREREKKGEEKEEKKAEEIVDPLPAGASSVQPDADLQFLKSLLPALKRMDIRQREHTKLRIQQLVFDAEFSAPSPPSEGMHRWDSMESIPPKM